MAATTQRWFFWLAIGLLTLGFIYAIRSVLLPFVLGALVAYFLDPAADRLERLKCSRTLATTIIVAIFFLVVTLLLVLVVPLIAEQMMGLVGAIPELANSFDQSYGGWVHERLGALSESQMESLKTAASNISGILVKLTGDVLANVFASGIAVVNMLSLMLITPIVCFYLLRDWDYIIERVDALLPREHAGTIRQQMRIIDNTLSGFIRGQLNVCMLLGAYYAIGLSLVGLPFGVLIGIATGFLVILPYVGLAFGMIVGLAVAFFQFNDWGSIVAVLAVFVSGQIIEGNFVTPKLIGEKVGLHPVWIIFGMLAGAALFGFVGILLAVPVTAVVGVLIRFFIGRYVHSSFYQDPPSATTP